MMISFNCLRREYIYALSRENILSLVAAPTLLKHEIIRILKSELEI